MTPDQLEERLKRELQELDEEYRTRRAPIIAQLVELACLKPPPPMIVCAKCFMVNDGRPCPTCEGVS